jgi:hypothetical protein
LQTLVGLVPHPASPPRLVEGLSVRLSVQERFLWLNYEVEHRTGLLLWDKQGRQDGLWSGTCFELFAREPGAAGYIEFNFAPLAAWAAYSFSGRRTGMTPLAGIGSPHLVDGRLEDRADEIDSYYELAATIAREGILAGRIRIGLSAVLEEIDGTKSYWALAHPPGEPDFHHPDCFALELPAATAA